MMLSPADSRSIHQLLPFTHTSFPFQYPDAYWVRLQTPWADAITIASRRGGLGGGRGKDGPGQGLHRGGHGPGQGLHRGGLLKRRRLRNEYGVRPLPHPRSLPASPWQSPCGGGPCPRRLFLLKTHAGKGGAGPGKFAGGVERYALFSKKHSGNANAAAWQCCCSSQYVPTSRNAHKTNLIKLS